MLRSTSQADPLRGQFSGTPAYSLAGESPEIQGDTTLSGYTPVFRSVFTGSLCGQWPDTAAWLSLLALADKNGEVDMTPQYISSVTGMPLTDLLACIGRFLEPDPMSRTPDNEGRRLELIDSSRNWGWRIINFKAYREKARLAAKSAREVESGKDAERKRHSRESAAVRRCPPVSDPSNAYTNSNSNTLKSDAYEVLESIKIAYPAGTFGQQNWILAERAVGKLLDVGEPPDALIAAALAYREQQDAKGSTGSQFIRSPEKFYGDGFWRGPFPKPKTKDASNAEWQSVLAAARDSDKRKELSQTTLDKVGRIGGLRHIGSLNSFDLERKRQEFEALGS